MDKYKIEGKFKKWWLRLSLKRKMSVYVAAIMFLLATALFISFGLLYSYLSDFNLILKSNNYNQKLSVAFEEQIETYHNFTTFKNDTNKLAYKRAEVETKKYLDNLLLDLDIISKERYLITKTIINSYESYQKQCDHVLLIERGSEAFIKELYESHEIQDYIKGYIQELINVTLKEDDVVYTQKLMLFNKVPFLLIILGLFSVAFIILMGYSISNLVLNPVMKLADVAGRITNQEYDVPDVVVSNEDEIGKLVYAFNSMKHSTVNAITTLKEKNEVEARLHKEEMQHVNMEKMLDAMKMRLLQSQINPHFLFNTLNVISGMAKIEDADTTDEMIMRLSKLLRYNLKTGSQVVPLASEISVIKDYFYIQEKRFGDRIKLEFKVKVDPDATMVPTFILQPLVENAIIHGIGVKEEGGIIDIDIFPLRGKIYIVIHDTGLGMAEGRLKCVREEVKNGHGENIGIGVSNVCARCMSIYPGSSFDIWSEEGFGTTITIKLKTERGIDNV